MKTYNVDAHAFTRKREKEIREAAAQPGPKLALHPEQWEDFKAAGYDMSSFTLVEYVAQNWGDTIEITDDPVNHPKHYNDHPSGVECITITRHMNFNIGNAIKYLWRAGRKDKDFEIQDLRKAIWYIEDEIKMLERSK